MFNNHDKSRIADEVLHLGVIGRGVQFKVPFVQVCVGTSLEDGKENQGICYEIPFETVTDARQEVTRIASRGDGIVTLYNAYVLGPRGYGLDERHESVDVRAEMIDQELLHICIPYGYDGP